MAEPSYWSLAAGLTPAHAQRLAPAPTFSAEPAFAPDEVLPEGDSFTSQEQPALTGPGTEQPGESPVAVGRVEPMAPVLPTVPPVIVAAPIPTREGREQSDPTAPLPRMTHGLTTETTREPAAPVMPKHVPPRAKADVPEVTASRRELEAKPSPPPLSRSDVILMPPGELPEDAGELPQPGATPPASRGGLHIGKVVIEIARPVPPTPVQKPPQSAAPEARPPERLVRGFGTFGLHQG